MNAEQMFCQSMQNTNFMLLTIALFAIAAALMVIGVWIRQQHVVLESLQDWRENIEERYWSMQRRHVTVAEDPVGSGFYDTLKSTMSERIREFDEKLRKGFQNDQSPSGV